MNIENLKQNKGLTIITLIMLIALILIGSTLAINIIIGENKLVKAVENVKYNEKSEE